MQISNTVIMWNSILKDGIYHKWFASMYSNVSTLFYVILILGWYTIMPTMTARILSVLMKECLSPLEANVSRSNVMRCPCIEINLKIPIL